MCKRVKEDKNNEPQESDDIDKFINGFVDMSSSLSSMAKSMIKYANESFNELNNTNEFHGTFPFEWNIKISNSDDNKKQEDPFINENEPFIDDLYRDKGSGIEKADLGYDDLVGIFRDFHGPSGLPFPGRFSSKFNDFFSGTFRAGKTPFGFYLYGTPLTRYYHECLNRDGESVWDSKGYWRCLFPNKDIPIDVLGMKKKYRPNDILTKEDFENAGGNKSSDASGKIDLGDKGLYFKKYDDLLNWKNIMYNNMKNSRAKKREELRRQKEALLDNRKAKKQTGFSKDSKLPVENERRVISQSVSSFSNSNSDTNLIESKEIVAEHFSDGTTTKRVITRSKPFGVAEWTDVNESTENINGNPLKSYEDQRKGWFWRS